MDYKLPKKRLKWWQRILLISIIIFVIFPRLSKIIFNIKNIDINTFNWINTIGIFFGIVSYTINWVRDVVFDYKLKKNLFKELESNFYSIKFNLSLISEFKNRKKESLTGLAFITNNTYHALVNTNKITIFPEEAIIPLTSFYNHDQTIRGAIVSSDIVSTQALTARGIYIDPNESLIERKDENGKPLVESRFLEMLKNLESFFNVLEKSEEFEKWQIIESTQHKEKQKSAEIGSENPNPQIR